MARKFEMSWDGKPNFRWVKMYHGVRHRVYCAELGLPESQWTELGSYQAANEWWHKKKAELSHDPVVETYAQTIGVLTPEKAKQILEAATVVKAMMAAGPEAFDAANIDAATVDQIASIDMGEYFGVSDGKLVSIPLEKLRGEPTEVDRRLGIMHEMGEKVGGVKIPASYRLKAHVDKLIADERARQANGDIKPETYRELRVYLHSILKQGPLTEDMDVRKINEETVRAFNNWLKEKSPWGKTTRRKVWRFFDRLVYFLYSSRLIELPRNLKLPSLKIKVRPTAVERFDLDHVKKSVNAIKSDRNRLYALLALNCGMLGVDIGSLSWDELNQKEWRIVRARTKTENSSEDVPTVNYKLWDETVRLLKGALSKHPKLVLASTTNTPLWNSYIDADGKPKKNDLISQQWKRANCPILLSSFRSIGATIIGDHPTYGRYYHHYLGHSPESIGDKHYVPPSDILFDEILAYVGKQLGFVMMPTKKAH